MLMNATLLRIDDPPPAAPGPAISVRCSMGLPSGGESAAVVAMGVNAEAVLYLSMDALGGAAIPAAGQRVTVQMDGCPSAVWNVVCAADRVGGTLSHLQLFLGHV